MKNYLLLYFIIAPIIIFSQSQPAGTGTGATSICGGTFTDNGGSGANYSSNCNSVYTICPSSPGTYVTVTFTAFDTQNGVDVLYVFDGSTGGSLLGALTGNTLPAAITSSDPNGCLVFHFYSNGNTQRPGWQATVSCSATPGGGGSTATTDCNGGGGPTVCSNATINGNSSGAGSAELSAVWDGCLAGEHQSSWYYFSPSASGTIAFTISPSNGTDDYDFALWGPGNNGEVPCPFATGQSPLRCSYAAVGGGSANTGLDAAAGAQTTEGSGGDGIVAPITVTAGEVYALLIDNYSSTSSPFTLTWNLTGGSSLDCTILPIELLSFEANADKEKVLLNWSTASELNNDFFTIERSSDGVIWEEILKTNGAGNSNGILNYNEIDFMPLNGTSYYKLKQTDFDGRFSYSEVRVVHFNEVVDYKVFPNPNDGNNFNLSFSGFGDEEVLVLITDVTGKTFFSKVYIVTDNTQLIAVSLEEDLPKGTYLVTASSNEKLVSNKIVVR